MLMLMCSCLWCVCLRAVPVAVGGGAAGGPGQGPESAAGDRPPAGRPHLAPREQEFMSWSCPCADCDVRMC